MKEVILGKTVQNDQALYLSRRSCSKKNPLILSNNDLHLYTSSVTETK